MLGIPKTGHIIYSFCLLMTVGRIMNNYYTTDNDSSHSVFRLRDFFFFLLTQCAPIANSARLYYSVLKNAVVTIKLS